MKRETSWDRIEYLKRICTAFNAPPKQEGSWDVNEPIMMPFEDGEQFVYPKSWTEARINQWKETHKPLTVLKEQTITAPETTPTEHIKKPRAKHKNAMAELNKHVK